MITRVHIRNFRCLVDVELELGPLTILVGPNASGKSAIIDALQHRYPLDSSNGWRNQVSPQVSISLDGSDLTPRNNVPYGLQPLHLDIHLLRGENQVYEAKVLDERGSNLTNVFATLTRFQQDALVAKFVELVPMYRDVAARPSRAGNHRLVFQDRWAPSLWHEPQNVSDGTILLLAFLMLQQQSQPIDIVSIEEPERALHPYLIGELMKMLGGLSRGTLGARPIQVILATHSAELLEFAEPEEVRFVSRQSADGATRIERAPTGSVDWANAVKEYQGSLGGLWLSGALGGVPGG